MLESPRRNKQTNVDFTAGGIEVTIMFPQSTVRELIVNTGRGVGWCPLDNVEVHDEAWLSSSDDTDHSCKFNIFVDTVWIPSVVINSLFSQGPSVKYLKKLYVRYKVYDKGKQLCIMGSIEIVSCITLLIRCGISLLCLILVN